MPTTPSRRAGHRRLVAGPLAVLIGLLVTALPHPAYADPAPRPEISVAPAAGPRGPGTADPTRGIVVRVDVRAGYAISAIVAFFPLEVDSTVLSSRGIYRLAVTDAALARDDRRVEALARTLSYLPGVIYAEPDHDIALADDQFHSWPYGAPSDQAYQDWLSQPLVGQLGLAAAHQYATGEGQTIAVLDTGLSADHPALAGRVIDGWDYVDDDDDPAETTAAVDSDHDGMSNEAYGHGTFVAGLAGLVAPDARILSERVLDEDGNGNVFVVSVAILDAADAGADVINLSFGTAVEGTRSNLLRDTIKAVQARGVVVVAAAGNDADDAPHYPASLPSVLGVAALDPAGKLSWYSNRGPWVRAAAPGNGVIGPMPDGRYASWSGTSMATPLVAGQAALLRSQDRRRDAEGVLRRIAETSRDVRGLGRRSGAIDIPASLAGLTQAPPGR